MFNNLKSQEFFNPGKLKGQIHIIGCGALGGSIGEVLTRTGITDLHIWDMDNIAPHNLGNQIFRTKDIGKPKTDALEEILKEINPDIVIHKHGEITPDDRITGYIFLTVDNIDLRRELCTKWQRNPNIKFISDGRMRLTDGNIHSADWQNRQEQLNLLASMQYTHEEALQNTPVSACGLTLSIVCTPRIVASLMVSNLIKFINTNEYNRFIQVDAYQPFLDAYLA